MTAGEQGRRAGGVGAVLQRGPGARLRPLHASGEGAGSVPRVLPEPRSVPGPLPTLISPAAAPPNIDCFPLLVMLPLISEMENIRLERGSGTAAVISTFGATLQFY